MEAPSVAVSEAVRLPKPEGVNVTVMLHDSPAPSELGLAGQFPPEAKSAGAVPPEMAMRLIVRGTLCAFLSVIVCAALVVPSARIPNDRDAGNSVTGAIPVPVKATD